MPETKGSRARARPAVARSSRLGDNDAMLGGRLHTAMLAGATLAPFALAATWLATMRPAPARTTAPRHLVLIGDDTGLDELTGLAAVRLAGLEAPPGFACLPFDAVSLVGAPHLDGALRAAGFEPDVDGRFVRPPRWSLLDGFVSWRVEHVSAGERRACCKRRTAEAGCRCGRLQVRPQVGAVAGELRGGVALDPLESGESVSLSVAAPPGALEGELVRTGTMPIQIGAGRAGASLFECRDEVCALRVEPGAAPLVVAVHGPTPALTFDLRETR